MAKARENLELRFGAGFQEGGEAILSEGAGGGWYALPWMLEKYERVLDLKPSEAWLLTRMLKHSWDSDTLVHISFRKVERKAKITAKTVRKLARSLTQKGYIKLEKDCASFKGDQRNRYDVNGIYIALLVCLVFDPSSKHNGNYGSRSSDAHLALCSWACDEFPNLNWELLEGDAGDTRYDVDCPEDHALAYFVERLMSSDLFQKRSRTPAERERYLLQPNTTERSPGGREFPLCNMGEAKTTGGVGNNYVGVGKNYPTLSRYSKPDN